MGLLDLGYGSSSQKQTSTTTQNQTQNQKQAATSSGVTTTLDPATIATLQGIIAKIAPTVGQSPDAAMIRQLSTQLATNLDPALVKSNIAATQAAAVRNFNVNQAPQIANVEQQIGSRGNSFSRLIEQQGQSDLQAQLAQIATSGELQASAQRSADLGAAVQGFAGAGTTAADPLKELLSTVGALTGAKTTSNTSQTSISDLISQLISNTVGKTSSSGFNIGLSLPQPGGGG